MRRTVDPRVDPLTSFLWHHHAPSSQWTSSIGTIEDVSFRDGEIAVKVQIDRQEAEADLTYDRVRDQVVVDICNSDGRTVFSNVARLNGRDDFCVTLGLREDL